MTNPMNRDEAVRMLGDVFGLLSHRDQQKAWSAIDALCANPSDSTLADVDRALSAALPSGSKPIGHYILLGYLQEHGPSDAVQCTVRKLMRAALTALRSGGGEVVADGSLTYAGQRKVVEHMTTEICQAIALMERIRQRAEAIDCQPLPHPQPARGEAVACPRIKPLVWEDHGDESMCAKGFHIQHDPDGCDHPNQPWCLVWGEGEPEYFASRDDAKADAYRQWAEFLDGEVAPPAAQPAEAGKVRVTESAVIRACKAFDPMYEHLGGDSRSDFKADMRRALEAALAEQARGGGA